MLLTIVQVVSELVGPVAAAETVVVAFVVVLMYWLHSYFLVVPMQKLGSENSSYLLELLVLWVSLSILMQSLEFEVVKMEQMQVALKD